MLGNSWLKKLLDPQSYGLAVMFALILHIGVIALFAIEWPKEKRQVAEPTPQNIQAKVIQVESKQSKQRKLAAEKRRKNENWKKHLAKKKAAREKAAKNKAAKNKAAKNKAAKAKAKKLADKKKAKALKDKALKKAADLKKVESLKKAEALKEKERLKQEKLEEQQAFDEEQEQLLMEALAVEEQQRSIEKAMADEQMAKENESLINDIAAQIEAKISEAWRYPPSARPDMRTVVRINLVPTGEVVSVSIVKSSGNEAVDRSVIAAVKRAQPLPVTKNARLFEQEFRYVTMGFSPKDAVW